MIAFDLHYITKFSFAVFLNKNRMPSYYKKIVKLFLNSRTLSRNTFKTSVNVLTGDLTLGIKSSTGCILRI